MKPRPDDAREQQPPREPPDQPEEARSSHAPSGSRAGAEPEAFTGGGPVVTPDDAQRPGDGPAWSTDEQQPWYSQRRWAGRLGFPLMVLALLFAWQGVQAANDAAESALPTWAWWTLAMLCAFFGLLMVRKRYEPGRRG